MSDPVVEVMEARVTLGDNTMTAARTPSGWLLSYGNVTIAQFTDDQYDTAVAAAGDYLAAVAEADSLQAQADDVIAKAHDTVSATAKPFDRSPPIIEPAQVDTTP